MCTASFGIIERNNIIISAQCNNIEVISLLLKAPNNQVNKTDAYGMTALMYAAQRGHEQAVILLLKWNASRRMSDRSGKTAIDYATMEGKSLIAAIIEADPYIVHIHDMICAN